MTSPDPSSDADRNRRVRQANLESAQLAANPSATPAPTATPGFSGRWARRHWVQASLMASIGAVVVALVPGLSGALPSADGEVALTTMSLPLPPAPARPAAPTTRHDRWQLVTVEPGQTLGGIFADMGVPSAMLQRILNETSAGKELARVRPGVELGFDLRDGILRGFRFPRSRLEHVELAVAGDELTEQVITRPVETSTRVVTGEINNSLYGSARQAGLSPRVISTLTDSIFQYDIDFSREIQPGDRYSLVLEELWSEGELIGTGEVLAATFTTGGKTFSGFRFELDGKAGYYTADGRPLKRSFIRSPIEFARLSSNFGARRHPILGTMRVHKGVDYAARTGTPIMAAGDARVQFKGRQRGYGNVVILDHGRGHTTLYAHMSRFAGIRQGQRVSQGQVIGYVGATGMATGPHLHYEFRVNGVHRNPLAVTMPPPEPLKGEALARFKAQTAPALARIEQAESLRYAQAAVSEPDNGLATVTPARDAERG